MNHPVWQEAAFDAPNAKTGFSIEQLRQLVNDAPDLAVVKAVVGWRGQIQRLIFSFPTQAPDYPPESWSR